MKSEMTGCVFESPRGKMVDVLGIEFLKRSVKKFVIAGGSGVSRYKYPPGAEDCVPL